MLANRVHETSTTTGTGNLTLAGAVTNLRTFASQFAVNARFYYTIDNDAGDFESGIGYLSDSTTLVRESVLDSSNAGALVSFTGTLQVFVAQPAQYSALAHYGNDGLYHGAYAIKPTNLINRFFTTVSCSGDQVFYVPILNLYAGNVTGISVEVTTAAAAGGLISAAIYERNRDGSVGPIIAGEGSSMPADTTGHKIVTANVPSRIPVGWLWAAVLPTLDCSVRASNYSQQIEGGVSGHLYRKTGNATFPLPATPVPPTATLNASQPVIRIETAL